MKQIQKKQQWQREAIIPLNLLPMQNKRKKKKKRIQEILLSAQRRKRIRAILH